MAKKERGANQAMKWGKSRALLVIFSVTILVIGLGFALWAWNKRVQQQSLSAVTLKTAPTTMRSVPGEVSTTPGYEKLVRQANVQEAQIAIQRHTAAVPTLTRAGATPGNIKIAEMAPGEATNPGCDPKELERARNAGVKVDELRCKGCNADQLHAAGYSAGELVLAGFTAKDLTGAGYTAAELKDAGLSAKELMTEAGFGINDLKNAGFTPSDLKNIGGVDVKDLKAAGYTVAQLKAAGYSAQDLKAAGATLDELKSGGYGASDLKKAAYTALDLAQAGYAPEDLVAGGFSDSQIADAGIPPDQINTAKSRVSALQKLLKECNPTALTQAKNAGVTATEVKQRYACPPTALKSAGYSVTDLRAAGYPPKDILEAPFTPVEMKAGGFDAKQLKDLGYSASALKAAGFSVGDLKRANFTPSELAKAPFGANELRTAGLGIEDMKEAGFTPEELKLAGYTDGDLLRGGFTPKEIGAASKEMTAMLTAAKAPVTTKPPAIVPPVTTELPPPARSHVAVTTPPSAFPTAAPAPVSAIPTTPAVETNPEAAFAASAAVSLTPQESRAERVLAQIQKRNERVLNAQQHEEALRSIQAGMAAQANDLFSTWNPPPTQQVVHGVQQRPTAVPQNVEGAAVLPGPTTLGASPAAVAAAEQGNTLKAGTILFAVLDTGVNSDEQSPILATIIGSQSAEAQRQLKSSNIQLKNSKLLGQFTRVDKKLVLNFTTLSVPNLSKSIAVNAVAIDPDTARTALASDVNNHYLLRYGTLFASSFLQGLGTAVSQSGSTVVFQPTGNTFITNPSTSAVQKGLVALGNVGTQYAATLGQNFQKPPTVTLNAGTALGILLMADLTIPQS
ncbi:MAG TPA: TrbI/VirB10 family protein [Gammaproteobacteria bacterium]|nr:TrbI/VirB10 family protein [Gammaproteobacteria bacterium]